MRKKYDGHPEEQNADVSIFHVAVRPRAMMWRLHSA